MSSSFSKKFIENIKHLIGKYKKFEVLEQIFEKQTGIENFFKTQNDFDDFNEFLDDYNNTENDIRDDYGDFQTPLHLTNKICEYLTKLDFSPEIILEPTCGTGNFIISAIKYFPSLKHIYCVEIQPTYEWLFKLNILKLSFEQNINIKIEFYRDDIFSHEFSNKFLKLLRKNNENFLILGNPPWITNSELSSLRSKNLPKKFNIKKLKGLEAITGSANFDIAEFIILKLIQIFSFTKGTLGVLCKTSVVKNIVRDMNKLNLNLAGLHSFTINSKKEFNISAESALFLAIIGDIPERFCTISSLYKPEKISNKFGWIEDNFVSNMDIYRKNQAIEGKSILEWRQGIKHDAINIMVLKRDENDNLLNGLNEFVNIENDLIYPFVKGSNIRDFITKETQWRIILTQKFLNQNTNYIEKKYPKTWKYLTIHSEKLSGRKSKIYKKSSYKFSIFGIGNYSFKPFKVAIAGFYKDPIFSLLFPLNGKPIMVDDTSYQLAFDNFRDAFYTWILLNLDEIKNFLSSIIFLNSKRPYTKRVLMRIDILKLLNLIPFLKLKEFYNSHLRSYYEYDLGEIEYEEYRQTLRNNF